MTVALIAPGVPMMVTPRSPVLLAQLAGISSGGGGGSGGSSGGGGSFSGPYPSAISGLTGWWDAGVITDILDQDGDPIAGWNSSVGALADKSGAGAALEVYHYSGATVAPRATPRLNALLGGLGLNTIVPPNRLPAVNQPMPVMDPDQGLQSNPVPLGSQQAWTLYLVWSRPNWRQNTSSPSTLLSADGTDILTVDNNAGTGNLTLFPGSSRTVVTGPIARRHTHAVIIRNTPGSGIDVWLSGFHFISGATNPFPSTLNTNLLFLHDGTNGGGAQCWFHEAATWGDALSSGDITTLISCGTRWTLGARKGVQILVTGQSNSGNGYVDGAWHLLAQGVAYHLGALAYGVIGVYNGGNTDATMIGGEGIYDVPGGDPGAGLTGSFVVNPNNGSNPDTWAIGSDGDAVQTFLNGSAAEDLADIVAILWPWSETDSTRVYSELTTFTEAAEQWLVLERGMLSRSAASLPLLWWNAMPFPWSNNTGMQMHRAAVAAVAAASAQNCVIVMPQTSDTVPQGSTYNAQTGVWAPGSQQIHMSSNDLLRLGMAASPVAAAAVLASTGGDTITSIPSGIPQVGGPRIVHAYLENSTTIIVTVQHDPGYASASGLTLVTPLQASTGVGFAVMVGGSLSSPGMIINASACAVFDATHLQLTMASAITEPAADCMLFYPYGYFDIGTGNAVTDNYSEIALPTGWNIMFDLSWTWTSYGGGPLPYNYPLQATATPIRLSSTPD